MAIARYKDLCIDAVDPVRMSEFWARALGLRIEVDKTGGRKLIGPTPQHGVWINDVPELVTVKQRVHLDVNARSVAEYEAMGARVLPGWGPFAWTVMADPEGGEFCVFERDKPPAPRHSEIEPRWDASYRVYELCVDAVDGQSIASWWADVFGTPLRDSDREFFWIEDIDGCPFESIVFIDVPEPRTVKNRIHWDVGIDSAEAVAELQRRGASVLREPDDQIEWTVMADPEGNEFCCFVTAGAQA